MFCPELQKLLKLIHGLTRMFVSAWGCMHIPGPYLTHFTPVLLEIATQKSASGPNIGYCTTLHKLISVCFIYFCNN